MFSLNFVDNGNNNSMQRNKRINANIKNPIDKASYNFAEKLELLWRKMESKMLIKLS